MSEIVSISPPLREPESSEQAFPLSTETNDRASFLARVNRKLIDLGDTFLANQHAKKQQIDYVPHGALANPSRIPDYYVWVNDEDIIKFLAEAGLPQKGRVFLSRATLREENNKPTDRSFSFVFDNGENLGQFMNVRDISADISMDLIQGQVVQETITTYGNFSGHAIYEEKIREDSDEGLFPSSLRTYSIIRFGNRFNVSHETGMLETIHRDNQYVRFNQKVTGWDTEEASLEEFRIGPKYDEKQIHIIGEQAHTWITSIKHSITSDSSVHQKQHILNSLDEVNAIICKGVNEPELIAKNITREELETAVTDVMQYVDIASEIFDPTAMAQDIQTKIEPWATELTGWDNANRNKIRDYLRAIFKAHITTAMYSWNDAASLKKHQVNKTAEKLSNKLLHDMETCVTADSEKRAEIQTKVTEEFTNTFLSSVQALTS